MPILQDMGVHIGISAYDDKILGMESYFNSH